MHWNYLLHPLILGESGYARQSTPAYIQDSDLTLYEPLDLETEVVKLNALEAYTMVCMAHSLIDKSAQSFNREDEHPQKRVRDYTTHCEKIHKQSELCLGVLLTTQLRSAPTLCERACQSRLCQNAHCRKKNYLRCSEH